MKNFFSLSWQRLIVYIFRIKIDTLIIFDHYISFELIQTYYYKYFLSIFVIFHFHMLGTSLKQVDDLTLTPTPLSNRVNVAFKLQSYELGQVGQ